MVINDNKIQPNENVFSYYSGLQNSLSLINELCANLCNTNISVFNHLSENYQYSISKKGEWNYKTMPLSQSICHYTISTGELTEISNVHDDERTKNLTFDNDYPINYYIGVPLRNVEGNYFGTLCAMDAEPKNISNSTKEAFIELARQMENVLHAHEQQNEYQLLKRKLEQRELLFKEIHHRIKNNLADICGILQAERVETENAEVREILYKTENRIISAVKLHELLYETEDLDKINLKIYLGRLVEKICEIGTSDDSNISCKVDVDENIYLGFNQVLPVGLIVNELITNSLEHAFPDEQEGNIVKVEGTRRDGILLKISDNGEGIREHEISDPGRFGFKLVQLLAGQLNADFRQYVDNGSIFELEFKADNTSQFISKEKPKKKLNHSDGYLPAVN